MSQETATEPNRPASHITWADGVAWAAWAGLRPMTEFEFEKAARLPADRAPEAMMGGQNAQTRPQAAMAVFENEPLPELAKAILQLHQEYLESDQDLVDRIGINSMTPTDLATLNDIQGDFDVKFIGSSQMASKELQLQWLDKAMTTFASIPGVAPMFPWAPALLKMLELTDQQDLEQHVADPEAMMRFMMTHQAMGQSPGMSGAAQPGAPGASGTMPGGSQPGSSTQAETSSTGPASLEGAA